MSHFDAGVFGAVSRGPTLIALVTVLALAGCADATTDGALKTQAAPSSGAPPDEMADEPGYVTGTVVDTELVPIPEVDVIVNPGEHVVQTNVAGAFKVGPLEPGSYSVRAEKMGYNASEVQVTVQDDKPTRVTLTIVPAASTVPYHETRHLAGYLMCHAVLGNPLPQNPVTNQPYFMNAPCVASLEAVVPGFPSGVLLDKWRFPFKVEAPGMRTLLLEMTWKDQQLGKDGLLQLSKGGQAEAGPAGEPGVTIGESLYGGSMANPFYMPLHSGQAYWNTSSGPRVFHPDPNATGSFVLMFAGGHGNTTVKNSAFFYEFRSDIWMTFFYHRSMTAGFTILPDK